MRMKGKREDDTFDDDIRKIGELMKDPKKWEEYFASRADVALDNWPGRRVRKRKSSAKSS